METAFEVTTRRFLAAGNFIEGTPEKVTGRFLIPEMKTGTKIIFEEGCRLSNCVLRFPQGGGTVIFGKNTSIRLDAKVSASSRIVIGDGTALNRPCNFLAWEGQSILVGKDCLFSSVKVRTSDMHPLFDRSTGKRINEPKDVIIEDSVWLGESVIVSKGARIGTGSVIGAASLVTGNIPAHCVVGGVPAKVIRENVVWQRTVHTKPQLVAVVPPIPKPRRFFGLFG
jgi:acetyltransferase-like isoleucine patch superfamily enzyme